MRKKTPPRYNQPYYSNSHYLVSNHKETSAQPVPAAVLRQPTAKYGALPAKTTCPYCYNVITTEISYQTGRRAWIAVISLALIGYALLSSHQFSGGTGISEYIFHEHAF